MSLRDRKARLCLLPSCKGKRFDLVHKFPMDNERAEIWKAKLNLPEIKNLPVEAIRRKYFICSKHFRKEDYKNCESRNLNKTAFPRLLLPLSAENSEEASPKDTFNPYKSITLPANNAAICNEIETSQTSPTVLHNGSKKLIASKRFRILTIPNQKDGQITPQNNNQSIFKLSSPLRVNLGENLLISDEIILSPNVILTNKPSDRASRNDEPNYFPENNLLIPNNEDGATALSQADDNVKLNVFTMLDASLQLQCPISGELVEINYFWLRDHCLCLKCYNLETNQRTVNILEISLDIRPTEAQVADDDLTVRWNDGHTSQYSIRTLLSLQHEQVVPRLRNSHSKILWRHTTIDKENYARVPLNDYLCHDEVAKSVVESLVRYGIAFIENVPANILSTECAIKRLFPVQKTLFGEMWAFNGVGNHSDTAYSNQDLDAHNDNTYFNDAAGLQIFHCIENAQTGGDTLLVDGFMAINDLKNTCPDSFDNLCTINVPSQYIEKGENHVYTAPIIRLDPITKEPEQLRFNMADRAPMTTLNQNEMLSFYKALRDLSTEIKKPANEWWFKLTPGTVCLFDNWRILHGRATYTGSRCLVGCYVSRTHFTSVARNFNLIE